MIYAKSGDLNFIQKIKDNKFSGYIHSIFNRVINLYNTLDSEIYTLAYEEMDNGPNTMVLNISEFTSLLFETNQKVFTENKTLYIEDKLAISIKEAKLWNCSLPDYPMDIDILENNLKYMKSYIEIHGGYSNTNALEGNNLFLKETTRMLNERIEILKENLSNHNNTSIIKYGVDLVGLGMGLTPSGDDFLVGLFTVINMKNNLLYEYRQECVEIASQAKKLTNDISYITLKKASIGQVRESLINFLSDITKGTKKEVEISLKKVLNIGSLSGTDIAMGIICGLEINLNGR